MPLPVVLGGRAAPFYAGAGCNGPTTQRYLSSVVEPSTAQAACEAAYQQSHGKASRPARMPVGGIGAGAAVMASFTGAMAGRLRAGEFAAPGPAPPPTNCAPAVAMHDLAQGAFASVRVETLPDGRQVAVKRYENVIADAGSDLQTMHALHLANELRLAGRLHHPYVLAPEAATASANATEFTMEYAPHGSLEAYVKRLAVSGGVPESEGQRLFAQLVTAVDYLHSLSIVHRDIKLENVVLDAAWATRLIDFGAAQHVKLGEKLRVLQGTPAYMAPEVLAAAQSRTGVQGAASDAFDPFPVDMWALGVCLYCLFQEGAIPFGGKDVKELAANIQKAPTPPVLHLSAGGRDLLQQLLNKAARMRPTVVLASRHAWIKSGLHRPHSTVGRIPHLGASPTPAMAAATSLPSTATGARPRSAYPATNTHVIPHSLQPVSNPHASPARSSVVGAAVGTRMPPPAPGPSSHRFRAGAGTSESESCDFCASMSYRSSLGL